jgi:transcriptional regulator with GAF, ATPase, and Fis domain
MFCCVAMSVVASCSDGGTGNTDEAYCEQLVAKQELLIAPMNTATDIVNTLTLYRTLETTAPVAVDQQWRQLADLLDAASTVDVNDQAARQKLTDQAYAAEKSAKEIADHASTTCQLDTLKLILPPPPAG